MKKIFLTIILFAALLTQGFAQETPQEKTTLQKVRDLLDQYMSLDSLGIDSLSKVILEGVVADSMAIERAQRVASDLQKIDKGEFNPSEILILLANTVNKTQYEQQQSEINNLIQEKEIIQAKLDTLFSKVGSVIVTPGEPVTNLRGTGGVFKNTLYWHPSVSSGVDSVQIRANLSIGGGTAFTRIGSVTNGTDTTFTHSGLSSKQTWYYYAYAFKSGISSLASNLATVTTSDTTLVITEESFPGAIAFANFENGTLTGTKGFGTTSDQGVGAELYVNDTSAIHNDYGFVSKQINPATENDYGYGTISFTAADSVYVRFYMTMSRGLTLSNATGIPIFSLNALNDIIASNLYVGATSTGIEVNRLNVGVSNNVTPSGWIPSDTVLCEALYKKGTGSDGIFKFWVNGSLVRNVTNLTNTQQCSTAIFGVLGSANRASNDWYIKFDDIVVNDSAIGSFQGSGGSAVTPDLGTIAYVSPSGNGAMNGADSSNAFSPSNITGIEAGTTLKFLGGSYTTPVNVNFSGTSAELVTCVSTYKHGAHFVGVNNPFPINDSYISFKNFKFTGCTSAFFLTSGSNVIYIDSNYVTKGVSNATGSLVNASGYNTSGITSNIDSLFIRWNVAKTDSQIDRQTDIIYTQYAQNVFIIGNDISQENVVGSQHNDPIQTAWSMGDVVIANNKIYNAKGTNSQGLMGNTGKSGSRTILYNNVVYMEGGGTGLWSYPIYPTNLGNVYAIHNTVYVRGNVTSYVSQPLIPVGDSVIVKNNILVCGNGIGAVEYDTVNTNNFDCNYNLYKSTDDRYPVVLNGYGKTLTYWKNYWLAQDANSINVSPIFTSTTNRYTGLTLQAGSEGLNDGTNLQSYIAWLNSLYPNCGLEWKTINGTNRDSTPDLGAY